MELSTEKNTIRCWWIMQYHLESIFYLIGNKKNIYSTIKKKPIPNSQTASVKDYQSWIDLPRIWKLLKEITRQLSKRVQDNDLCEWIVFPCFQEMSRAHDFWRLMYLKMTERLGKISSNIYGNTHFLFTVYCNVVLMSLHSSYLLTSKTTWTQWNSLMWCISILFFIS